MEPGSPHYDVGFMGRGVVFVASASLDDAPPNFYAACSVAIPARMVKRCDFLKENSFIKWGDCLAFFVFSPPFL